MLILKTKLYKVKVELAETSKKSCLNFLEIQKKKGYVEKMKFYKHPSAKRDSFWRYRKSKSSN
jgi:hypothetical protein